MFVESADHRQPFVLPIPLTSADRYVSGIVALNIPTADGTGDWHQRQVFFTPSVTPPRSFLIVRGQRHDPSRFLGATGIVDVAASLDAIGVPHPPGPVYAATHARAIADLVLVAALRGEDPTFVALDDYMPEREQKLAVFTLLDRAIRHISEPSTVAAIRDWIRVRKL
jgi:hypothetical protein